ncbi:hypothetical protein CDL12_20382 [Handroanthus impetiginosus]|uniref:FAF domain-containing protein n=1 Tax=Handroanthus impetiginosus TaxID=429701 RepID=A0A2G9GP29_9LAMI|nr:hypothetical protein CDL12_20382 [Handroanthus impetiginosus]
MSMKQGIVTILGSDSERNKAASIRRTLSADMSSKNWLQQNGFNLSPVKKINNVSSETLDSDEEHEKNPRQDDVWRSIQAKKERNAIQEPVWGSILTQKSESSLLPPPYVHPMVKRSSSTLSEKSLEICTESLGSETGSECFNSEILSDGDEDEDEEERQRVVQEELKENEPFVDLNVAKYRKSPARPFPPPLASIAGGDGAAIHMHSHRENGRLVLEAVSVPPRNYFHAQRGDGRLVLTLIRSPVTSEENKVEEFEKVFDNMEEVDEDIPAEDHGGEDGDYEEDAAEEDVVEEEKFEGIERNSRSLSRRMMSMHKSGILMKKLVTMGSKNPTWSKKVEEFDDVAATVAVDEFPIPKSLPSQPRVGRLIPPPSPLPAASFNAYDYFWRSKSTVSTAPCGLVNATTVKNNDDDNSNTIMKPYEHQDLVLVKGNKAEYFVPSRRGCKEGRRSPLFREPHCIAT